MFGRNRKKDEARLLQDRTTEPNAVSLRDESEQTASSSAASIDATGSHNAQDRNPKLPEYVPLARPWLARVTLAMVAIAVVVAVAAYTQMKGVQQELLSVAADQQDAYVQLVVDQIDVRQDRTDDEIISDILGTLDPDASKYWTFSKDGSVLFVKDVTETNQYQGLAADSYYDEAEAVAFYNGLSDGAVTHSFISFHGQNYIASGRAFEYQGSTYRLALLMNESVVLDNSQMLAARTRLVALIAVEAVLLIVIPMWLAAHRDRAVLAAEEARERAGKLNRKVAELSGRVAREQSFDARSQVWRQDAAEQFQHSLSERGRTAYVAHVELENSGARALLVERLNATFDEDVPRFEGDGPADLYVLFLNADRAQAEQQLDEVLGEEPAKVEWRAMGAALNQDKLS